MEYQLPTAIQNRLAQTGETPESFISRAVDTLVRKEMSQGFNDLPRHAVLNAEPLGLGLLLLTFADGDRRLFDGAALKGYPLYKEISSDYGLTCARVEGCSVVFEDKYGRLFPIRMFSFERFGVQDGSCLVARPAFSAVTLLLRCVVL